jgi:hypothetical protein
VARPLFLPGAVTGIGSLPHRDVEHAIAFALAATPALPAVPSLPQRDPREGMIAQALAGHDGFRDVAAFLTARGDGPVKVQLTGPVTLALALDDTSRARTIVRGNTRSLQAVLAGRPVVCFLDEPSFAGLEPSEAGLLVGDALAAVAEFATTGVHCCGPTDWQTIVAAGPDVLSIPVELAAAVPQRVLDQHVDAGGWVAWGAVPTDRVVAAGDLELLWRALADQLARDDRLASRSLVTPACGLATHTIEQAETVYALTRALGERIAAN